jgi:2-dehydropantoate 2-reductase
MNKENPKIVFFGAGVIGSAVGAWVTPHHENLYLLDQGEMAEALKNNGVTHYWGDEPDKKENVKVKVIDDIEEAADADVVVIGVKNFSLEPVAKLIKEKMTNDPVIVSMANGITNQEVLPKYFEKVIYCVVSYNGWMDDLGVVGYQKKGPLVIGTPDNDLQKEMKIISDIFNKGVETVITPHIQDAIHCKIVINLTNSLTTLIGHRFNEISDPSAFQKILSNLLNEGKDIIKADGHNECKLGGMPSWTLFWLGSHLPRLITKPLFEKNVKKMVVSSMAQDVIQRGSTDTELESINGYIVKVADKNNLKAPFNRTIYEISKREFSKQDFKPIDVKNILTEIEKVM